MPDTVILNISNMKCAGCVASVEQALQAVEGVEKVIVSLDDANATVTGHAVLSDLVNASTGAGFPAAVA